MRVFGILLFLLNSFCASAQSQFAIQGSSVDNGNGCIQLTPASGGAGIATHYYPLDITTNWALPISMKFSDGANNGGADGIAFILNQSCNPALGTGGAIGYDASVNPAIVIDFDTYDNGNGAGDIGADHINIHQNGMGPANELNGGSVQASPTSNDIEDGNWHNVIIDWTYIDANTQTISVSFDGSVRKTATGDFLNGIFGGENLQFWSVSSSTGGARNQHDVCYSEPNDTTYCSETVGPVTWNAPTRGTNYVWSSTPTEPSYTGQGTPSITVSPTDTTEYICDYTDFCGLPKTVRFFANVMPLPTATLTKDTTVCIGEPSPQVVFTGLNGLAPYTFTYEIDGVLQPTINSNGATDTTSIFSATNVADSSRYVLLSVSDNNACSKVQQQVDDTVLIVVNDIPTANITGTNTSCESAGTSNLVTLSGTGSPPLTFSYINPLGIPKNITSATTSAVIPQSTAIAGVYIYSLTRVADYAGCEQAQSGIATITANPNPIGYITGDTLICKDAAPSEITFRSFTGTAPFTFDYELDGILQTPVTSDAGIDTFSILAPTNVAGANTYRLINIEDANGCTATANHSVIVEVGEHSQATVTADIHRICQNTRTPRLLFAGTGGPSPYTIEYSTNIPINGQTNHTTVTGSGDGDTVSIPVPTDVPDTVFYTIVSVTDGIGMNCGGGGAYDSVIVDPQPYSQITANLSDVCLNDPDQPILFTGYGVAGPMNFEYYINENNVGDVLQPLLASDNNTPPTATIMATADALGTKVYTNGIASNNVCSSQGAGSLTLTIHPIPTATIAGTATICENTNSAITFTGAGGTAPYTFTYDIDGGVTQNITSVNGQNSADLMIDTSQGSYTINLIAVSDTYNCNQAQTGSETIRVDPMPQATAGNTATICRDGNHTLTGTSSNYGTINWTHDGTGTLTNQTTLTPIYTPAVGDAGNIVSLLMTVTSDNNCNPEIATANYTININALPTATIGNSATVCQNGNVSDILFTGGNGTAPYTFTYSLNGAANTTISTNTGNTITLPVSTLTPTTYTHNLVSVVDANGCTQPQTGDAVVTVYPSPTGEINGSTSVCNNDVATDILFTGVNGTLPYTFTYSINGTPPQTVFTTATNSTVTISASTSVVGTHTYSLINVQDVNMTACGSVTIPTAQVVVNPLPTATISSNVTVCQNDATPSIVFTGNNATAPYTFTYSIDGIVQPTISGSSTYPVSVPTTVSGTSTYSLISVEDSANPRCSQNQTGSAVAQINPLPSASISSSTTVCTDDNEPIITLAGDAVATAPYTFTYQLNAGNDITITATTANSQTFAVGTSNPGTFIYELISVTDAANVACSKTINQTNTVIVYERPTASISMVKTICQDSQTEALFAAYGGSTPYTFTYKINGVIQPPLTNPTNVLINTSVVDTLVYEIIKIEDLNCPQDVSEKDSIAIFPLPEASISIGDTVCKDSTTQDLIFRGFNSSSPYTISYSINGIAQGGTTTEGDSIVIPISSEQSGVFIYELTNITDLLGCSIAPEKEAILEVKETPIPYFTINPEKTSILEPTIDIQDASESTEYWTWDFGDGQTYQTSNVEDSFFDHVYEEPGTYKIKLHTRNFTCIDSTEKTVIIGNPLLIYIPNAFTPNGDGINEVFKPKAEGFDEYEMSIYDRWGNMIFFTDDIEKGWDGKANEGEELAQIDVYVYVIIVNSIQDKKSYTYRGVVNLIR